MIKRASAIRTFLKPLIFSSDLTHQTTSIWTKIIVSLAEMKYKKVVPHFEEIIWLNAKTFWKH